MVGSEAQVKDSGIEQRNEWSRRVLALMRSLARMRALPLIRVSALIGAWLLLAGVLPGPEAFAQSPGDIFTAKVERVKDGDTYVVRSASGRMITVRLFGVDTPEYSQNFGWNATKRASYYVQGRRVRVTVEDVGRYGRTIGRITIDGGDLSELLVRDGLAWHYTRYAPNESELARLQRQAQNAERGLWAQERPLPPWEWRQRN